MLIFITREVNFGKLSSILYLTDFKRVLHSPNDNDRDRVKQKCVLSSRLKILQIHKLIFIKTNSSASGDRAHLITLVPRRDSLMSLNNLDNIIFRTFDSASIMDSIIGQIGASTVDSLGLIY